ncbi:MAG: APC family permease [Terracidiphilus sp.]|jgi:amino acid transporter
MRLLPLITATYFMVSGGPYGIEDILGGAGYGWAIVILLVLPLVWSLPAALMIGELAAAIPDEGGFYVWVRRALGPFWGYQEGWLSLTASIFDMALYPSIFVLYLGKFSPALTAGSRGYLCSLAVVVLCVAWNLLGAPRVGDDSVWMFALLLAPFAAFVVLGFWHGSTLHPAVHWSRPPAGPGSDATLSTAILVALWNYMGWDNASTVAREVDHPQRNYPRAMIGATTLTAITYILPLAAMAFAGLSPSGFTTGSWVIAGQSVGGGLLSMAIVAGGVICGIGMFNALMMSYTRLPIAMASDGLLPHVLLRRNSRGVPWVSLLACGLAWALALQLPFERLISIDLILYGTSLILEFLALIVLRLREPNLPRPFRAGNFAFACLLAIGPTLLIAYALYVSRSEKLGDPNTALANVSSLLFACVIALLGPLFYWFTARPLARRHADSLTR